MLDAMLLDVILLDVAFCMKDGYAQHMMSTYAVVVTGFEPFNGGTVNPSWLAVKDLPRKINIGDTQIHLHLEELPVVYDDAAQRSRELIEQFEPLVIIHVGLHDKAPAIMLESRAVNTQNVSIPDNAGIRRQGEAVIAGAPEVLEARWDAEVLAKALQEQGFPVQVSDDAGRYVCNTALYTAIHVQKPGRCAGFVHVPSAEQISPAVVTKTLVALIKESAKRTLKE